MTQCEKVLAMLRLAPVCGNQFLEMRMPRYAARIYDLRRQGHDIRSEPCRMHVHESSVARYELADMDQLTLAL